VPLVVRQHPDHQRANAGAERLLGAGLERPVHVGDQFLEARLGQAGQQRFPIGEVIVERPHRHAGPLGDLPHVRIVEASVGEDLLGRAQHGLQGGLLEPLAQCLWLTFIR